MRMRDWSSDVCSSDLVPVVFFALTLLIFSMQMLLTPTQRVLTFLPNPDALKGGQEQVQALIEKYGIDDPFPVQYGRWIGNIMQGNLGWSETARMPVGDALITLFPATLELVLLAFVPSILGAIWLCCRAVVHHNKPVDHSIR